jgi:hypothetical protein
MPADALPQPLVPASPLTGALRLVRPTATPWAVP